jgi:putative flavoprotein involved in K+ transport
MKHTDTIIIGAGQAGLSMSYCLSARGIANVVLERGRLAQRWRNERWDSLRLLSPNWMARLPGYQYEGDDPEGFMTMPEFIGYLEDYADSFDAPVQSDTTVTRIARASRGRFLVQTDRGEWRARNVVLATGFCDVPRIPAFARDLPGHIHQVAAPDYRNARSLVAGNVLVVGASATGVQIADELRRADRGVTLAVGTHVRLPRRYRGRDILEWMVSIGAFEAAADPEAERSAPPPQLVGTPEHRDLDLGTLQASGVQLVGRALGCDGAVCRFADDLAAIVDKADDGLQDLIRKIDAYIEDAGISNAPPQTIARIAPNPAPVEVDLQANDIATVVWATGYERRYPWLELPVIDERGEIRHRGGVTPEPGLYVLGMRFQRTKGSNLIDGVGADAESLADHLARRNVVAA